MDHYPDLNRLAAFVEGRLIDADRQTVLTHLADCRECREVVALTREHIRPGARVFRRPAVTVWLPVAAAVAVATIGVLLLQFPDRGDPTPTLRPASQGSDRTLEPEPRSSAPTTPPPATSSPEPADDLLRRRGGARQVGTKTFRLVAGEWIDAAYDPAALLPVVDVESAEARRELLARIPALTPYAEMAERVLVVHEGSVYRFGS
jgi:hypothetical protein